MNPEHREELSKITRDDLTQPIRMEVNVLSAIAILGTLQLAFRHPSFGKSKTTMTAQFAQDFARTLQAQIVKAAPSTEFLCEAGWHEKFDY